MAAQRRRGQDLLARRALSRPDVEVTVGPQGEYWNRPGELLLHEDDYLQAAPLLRGYRAVEEDLPEGLRRRNLRLLRFRVPDGMRPEDVVAEVRRTDGEPRISLNHLVGPHRPRPMTTPKAADDPLAVDEAVPLGEQADTATPVKVGIVDTGLFLEDGRLPAWAEGRVLLDLTRDADVLDTDPSDGLLDIADGHGTFVASLVLQAAPSARLQCRRAAEGGLGDELEVADAMLDLVLDQGCAVLNLSFGGYTADDVPPVGLAAALDLIEIERGDEAVVVAAAGNFGRRRPVWPAAYSTVIAVAGLQRAAGGNQHRELVLPEAAPWSSRGWWVDAGSDAVDLLAHFVTFTEDQERPGAQTFSGQARWSGSSFAAAWVSGRFAQRASETPDVPLREVARRVLREGPWRPELGAYVPGQPPVLGV